MPKQPPPVLLLTRPDGPSRRFLAQVEQALGRPQPAVISPLIGIEPTGAPVDLTACAGVILTSQNALTGLAPPPGLPAWCVGQETARAARAVGFDARSADGDATALIALIRTSGTQGPLIHLRGQTARGDIAATLTAAGIPTRDLITYRQTVPALTDEARTLLSGAAPVIAPVFSPETMTNLTRQGPFAAPIQLIAISPAAANVAPVMRASLTIATRPDAAAMLTATLRWLETQAPDD
jgi:uroporphyrinogen-III synthase